MPGTVGHRTEELNLQVELGLLSRQSAGQVFQIQTDGLEERIDGGGAERSEIQGKFAVEKTILLEVRRQGPDLTLDVVHVHVRVVDPDMQLTTTRHKSRIQSLLGREEPRHDPVRAGHGGQGRTGCVLHRWRHDQYRATAQRRPDHHPAPE